MSRWELERWVKKIAYAPIGCFHPSFPAKQLGLDQGEATEALFALVGRGLLEVLWEISCPECFNIVFFSEKKPDPDEEFVCERCLESFKAGDVTVSPVFRVASQGGVVEIPRGV